MKTKKLIAAITLMVVVFIGCKKDDFDEIIGVCPEVISTVPTNQATGVPLNQVISVTFNEEEMDPETITNLSFTIVGPTAVQGTITYSGATAYFTPSVNLLPNTTYTGTVTTSVKDLNGNALQANYVWTFSTDIVPQVILTDPANLATAVALDKIVTATFNMPMNPLTINSTTFTIYQGETQITGIVTYNGTMATFTPANPFLSNKIYTGTVTTGAKNLQGTPMAANYVWTFTTSLVAPPHVILTDPKNHEVSVVVDKTITATFDMPMNPSTINTTTFTVTQGETPVSGVVTYEGTTAFFNPTVDLPANTTFTGTITTGAKNVQGVALENDYTWQFCTGCTGEIPLVIFTDPVNLATGVALNKTVTASFNMPMNPFTFNENTFTIKQGETTVAGLISYDGTTVSFNPFSDLLPNTIYTGTVTTGAMNFEALSLEENYVWTFTTIPQITLTSNPPAGGNTSGAGTFETGSAITVSALPNNGYVFTNWTEGANIVSTNKDFAFTVSGNRDLAANFTAETVKYNVVLSSLPTIGGTTSGAGSFDSGESVTVSATPNTGYTFTNWTDGVNIVSTNANYTFTISGHRTLVANFTAETIKFSVQLSALPANGGITTGAGSFDSGASVTVNAVPNAGFTFTSWKEGANVVSTNAEYTFTLSGNRTLVANFTANTTLYNVTLVSNPTNGGTTDGDGSFNEGTSVTVSATQNTGFTFTNWTEGSTIVSTNTDYTFVIDKNMTLTANFTANPPLGPGVVDLGTAGDFAILTKSGISTTGVTSITGDIGVSPAAASSITGFGLIMDANNQSSHTPIVTGKVYAADYSAPTPAKMTTAVSDMETAYTTANGLVTPAPIVEQSAGNLNGETLAPGLYKWATGVSITTGITLSGSATDTWVFQVAQDLTVANSAMITLSGGAKPENIVWVVAGQAVLGTNVDFSGVILSKTLISLNTGTTVDGRLLAQTAVTLNASTVVEP